MLSRAGPDSVASPTQPEGDTMARSTPNPAARATVVPRSTPGQRPRQPRPLSLRFALIGLLVGFVVLAGREVGATFGITPGGSGDSYELFAVSLTGVVGGVFALASGGAVAPSGSLRRFAAWYSCVYAVAGSVALIVCLVRLGSSTPLLRSLAATFLGTAVAAASAVFGLTAPDDALR